MDLSSVGMRSPMTAGVNIIKSFDENVKHSV